MFRLLISIVFAIFAFILSVSAKLQIDENYYIFPIEGKSRSYSANFGEFRPDHLHSGVDIRTGGTNGKRVLAAAEGYISRISLSPVGFGLALYVAHPNGTTSVYAHLESINKEYQNYLDSERKRLKINNLNLFPEKEQFKVKKGEEIARSGNSGTSQGPHLHFEIRETANQKPINPIKIGALEYADKTSPTIYKLYYVETVRAKDGINESRTPSAYNLIKNKDGSYSVSGKKLLWVGREGYFVISAIDRVAASSNTFGIYSLDLNVDGQSVFSLRKDGFLFSQTRFCNALSYYPLQGGGASGEFYQLRRSAAVDKTLYAHLKEDGILRCAVGQNRNISITLKDENGNSSQLRFVVRGKDDKDCLKPSNVKRRVASYAKTSTFTDGDLKVKIPAGALYENTVYSTKSLEKPKYIAQGLRILSSAQYFFNSKTPLHKAIDVEIKCAVESSLRSKVLLAQRKTNGKYEALPAQYKNGYVCGKTKRTGTLIAVADILPPVIEEIASVNKGRILRFRVEDNFSLITYYEARIDGEWLPLDLEKETLLLDLSKFKIKRNKAEQRERSISKPKKHVLEIKVSDAAKNQSTLKREIIL